MVLSLWCQKQTRNFAVETVEIPSTQESSHVEVTNNVDAHHFPRYQGYCHFELITHGKRVNQTYFAEIWKRLHEAVCRKRPEL
jgi:hypothetical protein